MRINLDVQECPALARLTRQPAALVRRAGILAAKRAAEAWEEETRGWITAGHAFTPRTGRLEQGLGWRALRDGAEVYAHAPHAGFIEFGTAPHVIRPRPGRQALRWFPAAGGVLFAREVHHPGTDSLPYFFADKERRLAILLQEARAAVAEVLLGDLA